MKKIVLSIVILIALVYACNNATTSNDTPEVPADLSIKDDKLAGFLMGGIYFFNGYGGSNEVFDMVKSGSNFEVNTKDFVEELDKNYSELMLFPFTPDQSASSKETLKNFWEIKDKETCMQTLDYLKKSGHHDEFKIYKKMVDENGGADADISKIGDSKDEEIKGKLNFIKTNYASISITGIRAWDYARYINNVCLGYSAGYISKEDGEKLIADILIDARSIYSNWDDYYKDFLMGMKYWGGDKENEAAFEKTITEMMEGNYSIYKYLPLK